MQYIKFLQKYLPPDKIQQMLPPLEALIGDFGLDVEVAWQIVRPLTSPLAPDTSLSPEDGEVDEQDATAMQSHLPGHTEGTVAVVDAPSRIPDAGRERALSEAEKKLWQRWKAPLPGACKCPAAPWNLTTDIG